MMQKYIHDIPYIVRRSVRSRRIRIIVNSGAAVSVCAPHNVPAHVIDAFVHSKFSWIKRSLVTLKKRKKPWIVPTHVRDESYDVCKARSKKFINDRVKIYAALYACSYNRIVIKDMKSRWGSCSKNKNLNFHYRLLFLPLELADYIVVHELCHLYELNHSKKFWRLVAQTIPEYRTRKALLRGYSLG